MPIERPCGAETESARQWHSRASMNRNVWLLFGCHALMNAVMSGQTVMAALVGHSLAVDKSLNTLPMAIRMTAMMCASVQASNDVIVSGTVA